MKSKRRSLQVAPDGIVSSKGTFDKKRNTASKTFMKSAEKFQMPDRAHALTMIQNSKSDE